MHSDKCTCVHECTVINVCVCGRGGGGILQFSPHLCTEQIIYNYGHWDIVQSIPLLSLLHLCQTLVLEI